MEKKNYTYMLRCSDQSLYTGWTTDLKKRLSVHNSGKGAKYTRCRRPVELVYYEEFSTKEEAMSREAHIKRMKKELKEELVDQFHALKQDSSVKNENRKDESSDAI